MRITVWEFKKDIINVETFLQACRYLRGVQRYIEIKYPKLEFVEYAIVLVGRKLDTRCNGVYLPNIFKDVKYYTYSYSFDGIEFNIEDDYNLTEEGFGK